MNYAPYIQKVSTTLTLADLAVPFQSGWSFWDLLRRTGLLLRHHSYKPNLHHLWRCSLKNFHQKGRQVLSSHQRDFVSERQSAGTAQICCTWHDQIFRQNLLTHGFWNSNFLCYFTNCQTGMNHFPNCFDVFLSFRRWRWTWRFTVLNWTSARIKTFVPLTGSCSTNGFVLKCLF